MNEPDRTTLLVLWLTLGLYLMQVMGWVVAVRGGFTDAKAELWSAAAGTLFAVLNLAIVGYSAHQIRREARQRRSEAQVPRVSVRDQSQSQEARGRHMVQQQSGAQGVNITLSGALFLLAASLVAASVAVAVLIVGH